MEQPEVSNITNPNTFHSKAKITLMPHNYIYIYIYIYIYNYNIII